MINKKHHVNSERNARAPVKLPNLKSAYLEHPGQGLNYDGKTKKVVNK